MKNNLLTILILFGIASQSEAVNIKKYQHSHIVLMNKAPANIKHMHGKYKKSLNKYGSKHFSAPYGRSLSQLSDWSGDDLKFMAADDFIGSTPITYIPPKTSL